jgi:hypothetical protein
MSPPFASPWKFNVTFGLLLMLWIRAPGWLYTKTLSPPSHRNPTGRGSGAPDGGHGRQPHDCLLTQVPRHAHAEPAAFIDHAAIVIRTICRRPAAGRRVCAAAQRPGAPAASGRDAAAGRCDDFPVGRALRERCPVMLRCSSPHESGA